MALGGAWLIGNRWRRAEEPTIPARGQMLRTADHRAAPGHIADAPLHRRAASADGVWVAIRASPPSHSVRLPDRRRPRRRAKARRRAAEGAARRVVRRKPLLHASLVEDVDAGQDEELPGEGLEADPTILVRQGLTDHPAAAPQVSVSGLADVCGLPEI